MVPNLEAFKNLSNRVRRRHRDQDSIENEKSSQPLNQTPSSATAPPPSSSSQLKKAFELSRHPVPAMTSKQRFSPSQSSKLHPIPRGTLIPSGMPSAIPSSGPLYSCLGMGVTTAAGSSCWPAPVEKPPVDRSQASSHPPGSRSNPIDLTGSAPLIDLAGSTRPAELFMQIDDPSKSPLPHLTASVTPSAKKPHPGPPENLTGYTPSKANSPASSSSSFPTWQQIWFKTQNSSVFPPSPDPLLNLPMPNGGHFQLPGQAHGKPVLDRGTSSGSSESGADALPPSMDIDSPEGTSESSPDPEQPSTDTAIVNATTKDLEPLRHFVHRCLNRACAGCPKKIAVTSKEIVKMARRWASSNGHIVLGLKCPNIFCTVFTCPGCGKAIPVAGINEARRIFWVSGMEFSVYWCCDEGKLAATWALACGWEFPAPKSGAVSSVVNKVRERTSNAKSTKQGGTFGTALPLHQPANAKGVGYGGVGIDYSPFYSRNRPMSNPIPKKAGDTQEDLLHEAYFRLLGLLLPSYNWVESFDMSPPDFLPHMLSRSPLIEQAAMMLSNNSMDEISRQYHMYDAMLDFVHALGSHSATAGLFYSDRNLYHEEGGSLLDVSFSPSDGKGRILAKDTSKSLFSLLGNLAAQSRTVLRHAQGNSTDFQNFEGRNLLKLSQRLGEVSAMHDVNARQFETAMEISTDPEINFVEWHRENCVKDVPDEMITRDFSYARSAASTLGNSSPARGRMKRLIIELSTLQTSLPEGIFVCHGSSRLDVMKVLIIGPKDTPYEHGMFEFDLYCPMDYPNSPPLMVFKTTNGGKTRFNPNLYEDGKSRENHENKAQSAKYNNEVRSWTLQYALLPWVYAVGANDADYGAAPATSSTSLWRETARLYLQANAEGISNSYKQAASKSKNIALQNATKLIGSALRSKGYLD
ncbi:hypothetical protein AAE478_004029 [Parahypoxylon ruwenzoriense]